MTSSCRCGATWTGLHIEHCCACHQTFAGTDPGDRHRTGRHHIHTGPERRRCLTPEEMLFKGMTATVNPYGTLVWSRGMAGRTVAPKSLAARFSSSTAGPTAVGEIEAEPEAIL